MATTSSAPLEYRDFARAVNRFNVALVLKAVARSNAALTAREYSLKGRQRVSVRSLRIQPEELQFVMAGIARTAIISGRPHRSDGPSNKALAKLAHQYMNLDAPDLSAAAASGAPAPLLRVLGRITYEQFGYQESVHENIGRTVSLLVDHADQHEKFPSPHDWETQLGCSLEHFIRIGLVLHTLAYRGAGTFTKAHLASPEFAAVWDPVGSKSTLEVIERWFATTVEDARAVGSAFEMPPYERWSYNPLVGRPVVDLGDELCVPWPWLALHRVTPTGLYHIGIELFGPEFPPALGHVFEAYVGTHLRLMEPRATVIREIEYTEGKNKKRTVDYFVVFPDLVLLVEVKAARPTADGRAGATDDGEGDMVAKVGKAFEQIQRSADMVASGHPAVAGIIPRDRDIAAIVVTLEPFNLLNTDLADDALTRPSIPAAVVSSHELESVVPILAGHSDAGARIFAALAPPSSPEPPSLDRAASGLELVRNPILDDAWDRFYEPWRSQRSGPTRDPRA